MNIVKMLNKQKEAGKEIVTASGDIIAKSEIDKANMKAYLAGVKSGEIDPSTSLADYSEQHAGDNVTIDEVIAFIQDDAE